MGTGTLADALAWVEYCNSAGNTAWAERRRSNGRGEPWQVTYWGLGNEMYGDWQVGAFTAEEYVREATRWARAIRMLDPRAKLVSCGMNGWNEWDRVVIDGMASLVDYHSLHIYTGSDDYWTNVLQPHQAERAIRCTRALIERAAYRQKLAAPPRIAYDEWNVWYRQMTGALEERYTFADALAVGTYLNIFTRNCDWVQMANLAQMVNAIAPIVTSPEAAAVQPIWYPVLLHSQAALDLAVDVHVNGPVVSPDLPAGASRWPFRVGDLGPFGLIDAAATVSGPDVNAHSVAVTLVNRSPSEELAEVLLRDFTFAGSAQIRTVTAARPGDARTLPDVETAQLEEGSEHPKDGMVAVWLPPRSFTVIEAAMTDR
jgi:alpha-N-arabinofuranosidase